MKFRIALVSFAVVFAGSALVASVQPNEQTERIAASFLLALGRVSDAAELAHWLQRDGLGVADLIAEIRAHIGVEPAAARAVETRACWDSLGREASEVELAAGVNVDATYVERVQQHLSWLAEHPAEYVQVLHRAYQFVVRRDAYAEELEYWKKQDTLSYVLLVGCIEDWARRNQPGLMVTAGTPTISVNSEFLATVRLTPAIAAEARAAAGLVSSGGPDDSRASGHNLVAAGAGNIATGGRIHFVAAGGANLASARATRL